MAKTKGRGQWLWFRTIVVVAAIEGGGGEFSVADHP